MILESGLHHKSLPSIAALPVTADTLEQRAEPRLCRSSPRQPRRWFSTNHIDGSGAIQAPEETLPKFCGRTGQSAPGQPRRSPCPRRRSYRYECAPLLSSTVCFKTKRQRAFQIKTLKMYKQQLSHTRELITLVGVFLLKTGKIIFNSSEFVRSYSLIKVKARKTH